MHETIFCVHSPTVVRATNRVPVRHPDPTHVVKIHGILVFFPKIRAHISRELLNSLEQGPQPSYWTRGSWHPQLLERIFEPLEGGYGPGAR